MNVICGGGPAGIVSAFYLKDYFVFDANPLISSNQRFILGPKLIQENYFTLKLIEDINNYIGNSSDLKLNYKIEEVKIAYENGPFILTCVDDNFLKKYSNITRPGGNLEKSHMSDKKNTLKHIVVDGHKFDSFDYLMNFLFKIVNSESRVIKKQIKNIDVNNRYIIVENEKIQYENLINTINRSKFIQLSNQIHDKDFTIYNKNFYKCRSESINDYVLSKDYRYIYSCNGLYTRKTYIEDYIVYETNQQILDSNIEKNKILDIIDNLPLQLKFSYDLDDDIENNIYNIGRFAEWNHKIKLQNVIEKVINLKEKI